MKGWAKGSREGLPCAPGARIRGRAVGVAFRAGAITQSEQGGTAGRGVWRIPMRWGMLGRGGRDLWASVQTADARCWADVPLRGFSAFRAAAAAWVMAAGLAPRLPPSGQRPRRGGRRLNASPPPRLQAKAPAALRRGRPGAGPPACARGGAAGDKKGAEVRAFRGDGEGLRRWRCRSGRRCICSSPCCGACRRPLRRR